MDERLYRQLVEGSPDAIILGDAHGVIQLWNAGAETIFGFSAAEAVGQSMDLIVPERLRARHWSGYDRVMATGVSRYGQGELLAVPATTKDGRTLSRCCATPLAQSSARSRSSGTSPSASSARRSWGGG